MPFTEEKEIPPIFKKILQKIEEKGQVDKNEFQSIIVNLRIKTEDINAIEEYMKNKQLIERIPKLSPSEHGGAKDVIIPMVR
jgi:hypothetical protein